MIVRSVWDIQTFDGVCVCVASVFGNWFQKDTETKTMLGAPLFGSHEQCCRLDRLEGQKGSRRLLLGVQKGSRGCCWGTTWAHCLWVKRLLAARTVPKPGKARMSEYLAPIFSPPPHPSPKQPRTNPTPTADHLRTQKPSQLLPIGFKYLMRMAFGGKKGSKYLLKRYQGTLWA